LTKKEKTVREKKRQSGVFLSTIPVNNVLINLRDSCVQTRKALDSSIYPILVLSKPDTNMSHEFLNKTFRFIQNINCQVVIDFDDKGSESKGFFSVFKSGLEAPQCDVHESEDYVDGTVSIGYKAHWIFANGYSKLNEKALGLKQWNRSKRKNGLSLVM